MPLKILLADDHEIVRSGLRSLIEKQADMEIVDEASNGQEALDKVRDLQPDLVIMDIDMPILNGTEATRQILREAARTKVLALSMHSDRHFVRNMLQAGACGYLLKDSSFDELVHAVRTVWSDQIYLSPAITGVVVDELVRGLDSAVEPLDELSGRERQILQLIASGMTSRSISEELDISIKTVESHRRSIMDKLHLFTVAQLTKYAIRHGLTSLEG